MSVNHVVLADRSNTIRKIVEWLFTDHGDIELKSFESGEGLQDTLLEVKPAVILVDINLPSFDGYSVCRFVNDNPTLAHSKVIILKGAFDPVDESRLSELDYHELITKPFDSSALVQMIEKIVAESKESSLPPLPEDAPPGIPEDMPEEIGGMENGEEINFSDIKKELDDDGVMDAGGFITDFDEDSVDEEVLPSEEVTQKGSSTSGDQLTSIGDEPQEEDILNPFVDDSASAPDMAGGETIPAYEQHTFISEDSLSVKNSETAQVVDYQTDFAPEDVISDSSETFVADASEFKNNIGLEPDAPEQGVSADIDAETPLHEEESELAVPDAMEDRWPDESASDEGDKENIEIPSFDAETPEVNSFEIPSYVNEEEAEEAEEAEEKPEPETEEAEVKDTYGDISSEVEAGQKIEPEAVESVDDFELPSFEKEEEPVEPAASDFTAFDTMDETPADDVISESVESEPVIEEEISETESPLIGEETSFDEIAAPVIDEEPAVEEIVVPAIDEEPVIEEIEAPVADEEPVVEEEVVTPVVEKETEIIEPPLSDADPETPSVEEPVQDSGSVFNAEDKKEIIRRVEERIAKSVHEVVWEIVPAIAEKIVKEEISALRKEIQDTIES